MKSTVFIFALTSFLFAQPEIAVSQNIYELRKLTEDDWLEMTTEERMRALGTAQKHAPNQTFLGNFGRHQDLYRKWGYDYYEQEDRYENYAFRNFEAYNILEARRNRWSYNEFGDRITKMWHSANIWREIHSGDRTFYMYKPYDYINSQFFIDPFNREITRDINGAWVAKEGTNDWAISVTGAGVLRTKFTSLTLSLPNIDGISIDFQSSNNTLKLVSSAYAGLFPNRVGKDSQLVREGGVMLRGGRFRRKFGVLTLGATYTTAYGVQGNRERGSEWRGTVINDCPTPIMVAVRFLDDSPGDGRGGPIVYDVKLKINGDYRADIIPQVILADVTLDRTTAITNKLESGYLEPITASPIGPTHDLLSINETLSKHADFFYINDMIKGYNSNNVEANFSRELANSYYTIVEQNGKELRVDGNETLTYFFDLSSYTENINRIEAVTTVANDYHIQTSMIYTLDSRGGHDIDGKPIRWYDSTYWRTAAQAEGNIKDGSNVRTIKIDFGFQVASILYGFDADLNYYGFKIRGEYVTNTTKYMFADGRTGTGAQSSIIANQPPRTGHRWSQNDHAYYVTIEKDWKMLGFSGEIFKMGKFYRPYLDYFTKRVGRNNTGRLPLIEDNDDNDIYPDTMSIGRTVGYRIYGYEDSDGVFPGNDADNDGLPDNNKNNNSIPDYDEPFYMFDVDPDDFVFGNDYNNNSIPDFREDDMKLDTPYDLDRQGHHFLLRYTPIESINFTAGSMGTNGVGISNRTNDDYFKFLLNYDVFDIGKLYAEYRFEKIQDNIRDPYIQVDTNMTRYLLLGGQAQTGSFNRDLYYDELEFRNSRVNKLFLDSKIRAVPSITLENHVRFERNCQLEGIMYDKTYQPHDILSTIAMVNKIVYTKKLGNFVFSPGVKFRFYKKARAESIQPLDHYLLRIPLVMLKYMISPDTDITLGMQGISGFPLRYTDFVQSHNDYRQNTNTLQLQNRTTYFGYKVWASVGITLDMIDYDKVYRQYEEYKSSSTFIKVFIGW